MCVLLSAGLSAHQNTEMPVRVLKQCHSCLITWTDESRLFSERLLSSCSGIVHQFSIELKIHHAMWAPTDVRYPWVSRDLTLLCPVTPKGLKC